MSSYIDVVHPERHAPYLDIPDDVVDYLHYLDFVKLRSPRTVNGYYLDLRGFFRYMMQRWQRVADDTPPEEIDLTGITTADIRTITKHDIFDFLDHARSADNGPKARARKLSALKGVFQLYVHASQSAAREPHGKHQPRLAGQGPAQISDPGRGRHFVK